MPSELSGLVFDVKRFALHDGPGIRTTAFLKGCPLTCPWCQNPEGIVSHRLLWYDRHLCIKCGACVAACPNGALRAHPGAERFIEIDRNACDKNGSCVRSCPSGALHWDSTRYTVVELVDLLERDRVFYDSSGGGVTLSGGEPLVQAEFAHAVLTEARTRSLHTAIESTLSTSRRTLERIVPVVDHILADIKIWDRELHRSIVGVDNEPILSNISYLANVGTTLTIRIPLIPGITALAENIRPIAAFVRDLPGQVPLELINFNPLAAGKYRALERKYEFASYTSPYPPEEYAAFVEIARKEGAHVVT